MSTQDIIVFVQNDTRSKAEIFNSLKQSINEDYDNRLSEEEAVAATHRFIALFQIFSDRVDTHSLTELDKQI